MRKVYRAAAHRRGSQIAEASLVYPVIIVVSVMSVAAMAHFYSCAAKAAAMSIDVRSTADEKACSEKGPVTYMTQCGMDTVLLQRAEDIMIRHSAARREAATV